MRFIVWKKLFLFGDITWENDMNHAQIRNNGSATSCENGVIMTKPWFALKLHFKSRRRHLVTTTKVRVLTRRTFIAAAK